MRILHLLKTSEGASWALRQMQQLVRLGHEVHVALPGGGRLVSEYVTSGITVHDAQFALPVSRPWLWPALGSTLRKLVDVVQPDLIHSHFVATTLTARMALGPRHPIPRLFQVPGPLHLEHPVISRAEVASGGSADYWMGSCLWTCRRYEQLGVAKNRIFLSYYGSDLSAITPRAPGKLRRELRLEPGTKVVGMVAYMYAPKRYLLQQRGLKGHEDLIDALQICLRKCPDLVGVMVGGPWNGCDWYERRIRHHAASRVGERLHFLGTRRDVPELYADFDVAVHPSHSENCGGAAESLLLQVPTIATNVGGFPDLVIPDKTGWLVAARSPQQLADTILAALEQPDRARDFAQAGRAHALTLMDVRRNGAEVDQAYRQILNMRSTATGVGASVSRVA